MDDQQCARELLADIILCRDSGCTALSNVIRRGEDHAVSSGSAIAAITAALRAAPDAVALRTAIQTLEQIASAPDDKGAKFLAAGAVAFLTTQGANGPEGFAMVPVEPTQEMLDAGGVRSDAAKRRMWTAMLAARPQGVE